MEIEGLERLSEAKDEEIRLKEAEKLHLQEESTQVIEELLAQQHDDPKQMKVLFNVMLLGYNFMILGKSLSELQTSVFGKVCAYVSTAYCINIYIFDFCCLRICMYIHQLSDNCHATVLLTQEVTGKGEGKSSYSRRNNRKYRHQSVWHVQI